jgi:predicted transposase/invertase (TIGR01784 family)
MPENKSDKGYRRLLRDKRNFLDLVKSRIAAPWAEQIDASRLELIDKRFVTKDFQDRESDIVFRAEIGDADVVFYVLLELQSKVDFTMPFRLLEYMVELLRRLFADAGKKTRAAKGFRLPAVVPIVLYNGADEWSCVRSFKEYLAGYELFAPNVIDFEYVMINVNEPGEAELLKSPTLVNLAMLADMKGKPGNVLRRLGKIIDLGRRLTDDEKTQLREWVRDVALRKLAGKVGADAIERISKAFEREEVPDMTYAVERAIDEIERRGIRKGKREGKREGERKGKREGEREGKVKMAQAMINDGIHLEMAAKYSGIPADELEKLVKAASAQ